MKSLYLRSCVALVCAVGLAACGGSGGNLVLGGQVVGLAKDGLVISNNGGTPLAVPNGSITFQFPDLIGNDTDFNVTVTTQPTGAVCSVLNGVGKSATYNVTNLAVLCTTNQYKLGGTISGQRGTVVLANGSDTVQIVAGGSDFTFANTVGDGSPFGVSVLSAPAGQSCSVANGSALMGSAAYHQVQVTCTP